MVCCENNCCKLERSVTSMSAIVDGCTVCLYIPRVVGSLSAVDESPTPVEA